jgi:hypothetical protein
LTCMTTAAEWAKRIEAWRASGQDAQRFCEERGYSATRLAWWSSHFRRKGMKSSTAKSVALARVVPATARRELPSTTSASSVPGLGRGNGLVVHVGNARLEIGSGVDQLTLATVLEVLFDRRLGAAK